MLICFSLNTSAQKSIKISKNQDINDFFASFVKNLDQTGDISKVSKSFFFADFKTRFSENDEWINSVSEREAKLFSKLSDSQKYEYSISITKFLYLLLESYFNKKGNLSEFDDEHNILNGLPKNIVGLIKQSKWFKSTFDDEVKTPKPNSLQELQNYITELNIISDAIKKFLNNRPITQKRKYNSNWAKRRKQQILDDSNTSSDICEGNSCMGLPEKTRIYALHAFSLCLRIAKVNGEFKIVNIYCAFCED